MSKSLQMHYKYVAIVCLIVLIVQPQYAHSGGTDRQGGHHDRRTGEYHFHHGYGPHDHPFGICEIKKNDMPISLYRNDNKLIRIGWLYFDYKKILKYFGLAVIVYGAGKIIGLERRPFD